MDKNQKDLFEWKKEVNWENLSAQDRISLLEKEELFDVDVYDDPPTIELKPENIDYLRKNPINRLKMAFANLFARKYISKLVKTKNLLIKEIRGAENFKLLGKSGAILTCNHFGANDSFLMQLGLEAGCKFNRHKKRMFKVIREGNYTNPPVLKFFMRNCNTLPLSSNMQTMKKFLKSLKILLERGDYVLIYPEEAMWENYKKPRPFKIGAFSFAVKNNVPVQPFFITMEEGKAVGENNQPKLLHTIHILPPIFPNKELPLKEQIEDMRKRNYDAWVKTYEEFYGKKLEFETNIKE